MKKKYTLISLLIGMALILAACVGDVDDDDTLGTPGAFEETVVVTDPTIDPLATAVVTEEATPMATDAEPTAEATEVITGTQAIPGTGAGAEIGEYGLACRQFNEMDILSSDGEEVGEIEDLVVNVRSGRVQWLVVENEAGDRTVVPWGAVKIVAAQPATLAGELVNDFELSVDAATFDAAPDFDDDEFLDDDALDWDVDLRGYWTDFVTVDEVEDLDDTGKPQSVKNFGFACSDFGEFEVVDSAGEDVGDAEDFVIEVKTGKIAYLVVENEDDDDLTLVPWDAVTVVDAVSTSILGGPEHDFQLTVDQAAFDAAPTVDDDFFDVTLDVDWDLDFEGYWRDFVNKVTP